MSPSCSSRWMRDPSPSGASVPVSPSTSVPVSVSAPGSVSFAASVMGASLGLRLRGGLRPAGLLALLARLLLGLLALLGAPLGLRLLDHGLDHRPVLERLLPVAVLLGLRGRGARRRVVPDHVELLAHGPQVRGGPVEEDT